MLINPEILNKIKTTNRIEDIIQQKGIQLKKVGKNLVGRCPFHKDTNPSLNVNPKRQLWHCFGCSSSGDVIGFVVKFDKVTFQQAVEILGNGHLKTEDRRQSTEHRTEITEEKPQEKIQNDKTQITNENSNLSACNAQAGNQQLTTNLRHEDLSACYRTAQAGVSTLQPIEQIQPIEPAKPPLNPQIFNKIIEYYHSTFFEDTRGYVYLSEERGIRDKDIYKAFRIGFANGSLLKTLPKQGEIIEQLKKIGLLNGKGTEFFYECLVFPIYNFEGYPVGVYGRKIKNDSEIENLKSAIKHLYLPGQHKGVFNWQGAGTTDTIILTEGIIDCLSLYQAGFKNTIPLYGTNGFTQRHEELLAKNNIKKIYICFDSDNAGEKAAESLGKKLINLGVDVFSISLLAKDANKFFTSFANAKELFNEYLQNAVPISRGEWAGARPAPTVERIEQGFIMTVDDRTYRVRGLNLYSLDKMRVNIRLSQMRSAECGMQNENLGAGGENSEIRNPKSEIGMTHIDTLDLYQARSRHSFVNRCARLCKVPPAIIEREISQIINEGEKLQIEVLEAKRQKGKEVKRQMTREEEQEAFAFLKNPDLINQIACDMEVLGYVGEATNKKLGYLIAISRKLEKPLSGTIMSQSSAGKSHLTEVIEKLTPEEDVALYSRLTPQALYYMEKDFLKRKLLIIEERSGTSDADYSIRALQSRNKVTQGVPIKDPNTGRIRTMTFEVEGPISYLDTTCDTSINPENASRCFEIYLDESVEQTRRIHQQQREAKTLLAVKRGKEKESIIRIHKNAQRLLKPLKVVIPFAKPLTFPDEWLRTRRDNDRFLNLIEAVAFLHQFQREIKEYTAETQRAQRGNNSSGSISEIETEEKVSPRPPRLGGEITHKFCIEATLEDYRIAFELAKDIFAHTLSDLKKPARELLKQIEEIAKEQGKKLRISHKEITFTRKTVREYVNLPDHQIRRTLKELEELELIEAISGRQGQICKYKLSEDSCKKRVFEGLLTPEELEKKLKTPKFNFDNPVKVFGKEKPFDNKQHKTN